MSGWVDPDTFARVVASRADFKRSLKALTTAQLIAAFESNIRTAEGEVAKLRREIADCMPGDTRLHGTKGEPGLLYFLSKAAHEAGHWREYLSWARSQPGEADGPKREPIASAAAHDPRLPRERDDEDVPF